MSEVLTYLLDLVIFFSISTLVQWIYPAIRRNMSQVLARWLPIFSAVLMIFSLAGWGHHWMTVVLMALTVGLSQSKPEAEQSSGRRLMR
jgi:phosphatidylserine synthase